MLNKIFVKTIILILFSTTSFSNHLFAQKPTPPIPIELFTGNENLNFQMVVSRSFDPAGKFNFFGLATYQANYENRVEDNELITINQLSYTIGKGFGLMAGANITSMTGISPIVGPQHNFANKEILAITVASFALNEGKDFSLFGLYKYNPSINEQWSFYSRLQLLYEHSLKHDTHNTSYINLRAGLKRNSFLFGLGANLDWSSPFKFFQDNYGGFIGWEFH